MVQLGNSKMYYFLSVIVKNNLIFGRENLLISFLRKKFSPISFLIEHI